MQPVRANAAKRQKVVKDESDDDFGLDDATASALMDDGKSGVSGAYIVRR